MIPEQELLDLLNKTEPLQYWHLKANKVMLHTESLPDLASRLWKRAVKINIHNVSDAMKEVSKAKLPHIEIINDVVADHHFLYHAVSVDRIVAAIIALQRAGVDVKESGE